MHAQLSSVVETPDPAYYSGQLSTISSYEKTIDHVISDALRKTRYPSVGNGWGNGPAPELFRRAALKIAFAPTRTAALPKAGPQGFLKSRIGSAERNHLEPNLRDWQTCLRMVLDELDNEIKTHCGESIQK